MQVAALLSDQKSLSVCGHEEALALVSVHKTPSEGTPAPPAGASATAASATTAATAAAVVTAAADTSKSPSNPAPATSSDPDLTRAKDLIDLHYQVQVQHRDPGIDADLARARREVQNVAAEAEAETETGFSLVR